MKAKDAGLMVRLGYVFLYVGNHLYFEPNLTYILLLINVSKYQTLHVAPDIMVSSINDVTIRIGRVTKKRIVC
jgi:hypothetical protein